MKRASLLAACLAAMVAVCVSNHVFANPAIPGVPYTEHFDTTAGWSTTAPVGMAMSPTPPTLVPTGGVDGSYISHTFSAFGVPNSSAPPGPPSTITLFRAQDVFGSSGDQFENNWISGGLNTLTTYVRHNAPSPLMYFAAFRIIGSRSWGRLCRADSGRSRTELDQAHV